MNFYRATVCFWCGKELNAGVRPARYGVCPSCGVFTLNFEWFIRQHNRGLDYQDAHRVAVADPAPPSAEPVEVIQ